MSWANRRSVVRVQMYRRGSSKYLQPQRGRASTSQWKDWCFGGACSALCDCSGRISHKCYLNRPSMAFSVVDVDGDGHLSRWVGSREHKAWAVIMMTSR